MIPTASHVKLIVAVPEVAAVPMVVWNEVVDMPCYAVATYTSAGTATVQAITDDTYQVNCVELATLIAIRIA